MKDDPSLRVEQQSSEPNIASPTAVRGERALSDRAVGKRLGIRAAITWLHKRANEMNDPHAKAVLDSAAFNLGVDQSQDRLLPTRAGAE